VAGAVGAERMQDAAMARPVRIESPGTLYHVPSRGNARVAVFLDDGDFAPRREWLRRTAEMYGWHVHAFEQKKVSDDFLRGGAVAGSAWACLDDRA